MRRTTTEIAVAPPAERRSFRAVWAAVAVAVAVLLSGFAAAQPRSLDAEASLALVEGGSLAAQEGAVLFSYHCAACHGDTGRGMAEARSAFPPSHRGCTRCHRPANPPVLNPSAIRPNDVFDIGVAPALLGSTGSLDRFASPAVLLAYVRATMPRPFPGSLDDDEYRSIVTFLFEAAGAATAERDATR